MVCIRSITLGLPVFLSDVLAACGHAVGLGARVYMFGPRLLFVQTRCVALRMNDHYFGAARRGAITAERLPRLAPCLPDGFSEIYFYPAPGRDAMLAALMPTCGRAAELAALYDDRILEVYGKGTERIPRYLAVIMCVVVDETGCHGSAISVNSLFRQPIQPANHHDLAILSTEIGSKRRQPGAVDN